jgi:threonylcarbamoyladenosine tRNA methylthiotransferase MtaB
VAAAGLRDLLAAGYREVVLTGINTGDWGRDLPGRRRLPDLLASLLEEPGDYRLRLNSVEPRRVTSALLDLVAAEARLCRHLQVPLQSGSDSVLRTMKRNYRTGFYRKVLEEAAQRVPGIGLGADVLVGFPGETVGDFDQTMRVVEESPLAFVHAFGYSPRPGTPAAGMEGVPAAEVKARVHALTELAAEKGRRFARGQRGERLRALALNNGEVLTDNFLTARLEGAAVEPNQFLDVTVSVGPDGSLTAKRI